MGLGRRIAALFRRDRLGDDPRAALEESWAKQSALLADTRRGLADVTTSRRRLEVQLTGLRATAARLEDAARGAVGGGQEQQAREVLTQRAGVLRSVEELTAARDALGEQEARLTVAVERLAARVETFRTQKDTLDASWTAAEAQTRIGAAFSGISEEMGDVGGTLARARAETERLQAQAGAVDELIAGGLLIDPTAPAPPLGLGPVTGTSAEVELELARLRAGALPPPPRPGGTP